MAFAPALVGLAHHILRLAGIQLRELFAQLLRKRQKRFTGKGLQFRFLRVCGKGNDLCHMRHPFRLLNSLMIASAVSIPSSAAEVMPPA